jgi:hypothetical protein
VGVKDPMSLEDVYKGHFRFTENEYVPSFLSLYQDLGRLPTSTRHPPILQAHLSMRSSI